MNELLDTCPTCGERSLIAVATVVIEYAITNDGDADQDWSRREVDDDSSEPRSVRCESCGAMFSHFTLDERGYLIGVDSPPVQEMPTDAMTPERFEAWLTDRVDGWCTDSGLTPYGEGVELGDLYRHLDDTEAFVGIGVTLIVAYEERTLFIVGPGSCWLATTGIELGIEGESIWHDPLASLRLDVPMGELEQHLDGLRTRADEIAAVLATRDQSAGAA